MRGARRTGDDPYTRVRYAVHGTDEFTLEVRVAREDGGMKPCGIDVV